MYIYIIKNIYILFTNNLCQNNFINYFKKGLYEILPENTAHFFLSYSSAVTAEGDISFSFNFGFGRSTTENNGYINSNIFILKAVNNKNIYSRYILSHDSHGLLYTVDDIGDLFDCLFSVLSSSMCNHPERIKIIDRSFMYGRKISDSFTVSSGLSSTERESDFNPTENYKVIGIPLNLEYRLSKKTDINLFLNLNKEDSYASIFFTFNIF